MCGGFTLNDGKHAIHRIRQRRSNRDRIAMQLRPFTDKDIPLMEAWLKAPHVAKWFEHPKAWLEEIALRKTKYSFIAHFIAEEDGYPVGFCQHYDFTRGGEDWNGNVPAAGSYSIDYLIGEPEYLGKGFGTAIVKLLTDEVKRNTNAARIIVKPESGNAASRNTLLSAGFVYDGEDDLFLMPCDDGN